VEPEVDIVYREDDAGGRGLDKAAEDLTLTGSIGTAGGRAPGAIAPGTEDDSGGHRVLVQSWTGGGAL
jgi:hypothetical protein